LISPETKSQIIVFLNKWIDEKINDIKSETSNLKATDFRPMIESSKTGKVKPFSGAFLVEGFLRIVEFERTLTGGIGSSFEECARLIALQNFAKVERGHLVKGNVTKKAIEEIASMVNKVHSNGRPKNYLDLVKKIVSLNSGRDYEERERISDLYLKENNGNETFLEIKSPKPNKGQCLEVLERHLHIHAIKNGYSPKIRTYFAMAFNPYGKLKTDFNWSFAKNYLDMENHVVLGSEFWELVGGPGTNEEIIQIYQQVGKTKAKDIIHELGF